MPSDAITLAPPPPVLAGLQAALRAAVPHADATLWVRTLTDPMTRAGITMPRRIAAFIGQTVAEAGSGYEELVENLNYRAARLCEVFPDEFPSLELATSCAGNPQRTANTAYAGKLGNGGPESGDGWRFRGRGLFQLTGRDEYTAFARDVGQTVEQAAEWCATPEGAAASACWYWSLHQLNPLADDWNLTAITRRINGAAMEAHDIRAAAAATALKAMGAT